MEEEILIANGKILKGLKAMSGCAFKSQKMSFKRSKELEEFLRKRRKYLESSVKMKIRIGV